MSKVGVLVALVVCMSGCAVEAVVDPPEAGDHLILKVEGGVDPMAVKEALDGWRNVSAGGIDIVVGEDSPDATLREGTKTTYSRTGRWMQLGPDQATTDARRIFIAHMIGRMLGMPRHDGDGIMGNFPTGEFTPADIESCRAIDFCQ